jgi:hypothetical protein
VSHRAYGLGEVRQLHKAGREAYVNFDLGVMLYCAVSELELLEEAREHKPVAPLQVKQFRPGPDLSEPPSDRPLQNEDSHRGHSPTLRPQDLIAKSESYPPPVLVEETVEPVAVPQASNEALKAKDAVMFALLGTPQTYADYSEMNELSIGAEPFPRQTYGRSSTRYDEAHSARQVVEALRFGVVPRFNVDQFTVGMRNERASIRRAMQSAQKVGGDVRAIVGEYGEGKSHLFEWTAIEAMQQGYIVASVSLDNAEIPPNHPHRIYSALVRSLRYPERSDYGSLGPLFEKLINQANFSDIAAAMRQRHPVCPLLNSLTSFRRASSRGAEDDVDVILQWIMGEPLLKGFIKKAAQDDVILLRPWSTAADQYCYLLSGIAWLARQVGYKGLVVLVDEAEHYSLLPQSKKERADLFFQGMIYSVLGDRQTRIKGCHETHKPFRCGLAHNTIHPYPFSYAPEQTGLLFMFAATTSEISLDYNSWLDEEQVILLHRISQEEIEKLTARIAVSHARAYDYDHKDDFLKVIYRLIDFYESGIFNLRTLIRYSVEVLDLISQHPNYSFTKLLRELNHAFSPESSK